MAGKKRVSAGRKTATQGGRRASASKEERTAAAEATGRAVAENLRNAPEDSLEMVNLSDLAAYQADITFRDGTQLTVPLVYQSEEEAEKERANYTEYMRAMMSHSEPFTLYFGSMLIRGEDVRVFNFHESIPKEEHEKIGFSTK